MTIPAPSTLPTPVISPKAEIAEPFIDDLGEVAVGALTSANLTITGQGLPKASSSKGAPPYLSAGPTMMLSTKTNIDSLIEHVCALAMDHQLSTPGSHIDWAGGEDDRLPDLDDWGVWPGSGTPADANPDSSESIEKARLQLMSPILDDSLKQLPQSFDKMSPSPSAGSDPPSPQIADTVLISEVNGFEDGHIKGIRCPIVAYCCQ